MFLTVEDFKGKYKLAKDCYSESELEAYIEQYEERYLQDLFGCDLYELFKSSLNDADSPRPQEKRFEDIFNPICVTDICGVMYRSEGIIEMLKGFVYYHYLLDQKFRNTMVGTIVNETSFSREVATYKSTIEDRYNLAVDSYLSIQLYMLDHKELYPEFAGADKRKSFFGGAI